MRLRLVRLHRSSSVCELANPIPTRRCIHQHANHVIQPNSIDAQVVLVTDANTMPTRASGCRQTGTRKARPLFVTTANAAADEPSAGFGGLLRAHRRAAGLTREQLAQRSGVSQRRISDMERGGQHVQRRDTVTLLARALDLSRPKREVFEGLVERSLCPGPCLTCRESIRRRSSRNASSSGRTAAKVRACASTPVDWSGGHRRLYQYCHPNFGFCLVTLRFSCQSERELVGSAKGDTE